MVGLKDYGLSESVKDMGWKDEEDDCKRVEYYAGIRMQAKA